MTDHTKLPSPSQAILAFDQVDSRGELVPLRGGLINQTWLWRGASGANFVLQRLNSVVFLDPDAVMANISRVTDALRAQLRLEGWSEHEMQRRCLQFLPSRSGHLLHRDEADACWRLSRYIEDSCCYEQLQSVAQVRAMAAAFGQFQRQTSALDANDLHETIADFHHTPRRWQALKEAYEQDSCGRAAMVRTEWEEFSQHQEMYHCLESSIAAGRIPRRVTHNDTKVSNLLFDRNTAEVLCVMDLDTTMPGSVLHDFGDMVRSVVPNLPEDATSFHGLDWQLDRYSALIQGFADATRGWLCDEEIKCLPMAGGLIALELGMRFLTDYLQGDRYFSVNHPLQNLQRSRAQLRFFAGLDASQTWAQREVERFFSE